MTFTKQTASHDKITIDGTDVSNSFREFHYTSEHAEEIVTGFSVSGTEETLAGANTQGFTGEAFNTEELSAIVEPLHRNRTPCVITYQPDGLVDATREIFSGTCVINRYESAGTVGTVRTFPFEAKPSTSTGITTSNWT